MTFGILLNTSIYKHLPLRNTQIALIPSQILLSLKSATATCSVFVSLCYFQFGATILLVSFQHVFSLFQFQLPLFRLFGKAQQSHLVLNVCSAFSQKMTFLWFQFFQQTSGAAFNASQSGGAVFPHKGELHKAQYPDVMLHSINVPPSLKRCLENRCDQCYAQSPLSLMFGD